MNELEFRQVGKKYGTKEALKEFSAVFHPGIYGILGPNGAGKSTMMNLLTDSIPRTSGEILYNGTDIVTLGAAFRAKLGYMPQQQGMYEQFTARRFLSYVAELKGVPRAQAKEEIGRYLEMTGLGRQADKKLGGFSGGMKQRVLFSAALLGNPSVLILDEPTAGLDPEERIRIRNFISETARDKIVLLATHVVSDIECIANEVLLMKNGRLVGQKSPAELIRSMEGKVAEVPCTFDSAKELQETYHVGNLFQRKDGLVLRLVGDDLPEEFERVPYGLNLEDVYLYYLEDDKGRVS